MGASMTELRFWLLPVLALALASTAWLAVRLAHSRRAQREERERLDHILDGSPVVTYVLDPRTLAPSYVSGNLHRLLGIQEAQLLLGDAQWWRSRLHPLDRDATIARFERWWHDGASGPLMHSYRLLGAQNRPIWVEDTLRAQRDAQGTALACIGAIVDVTERRVLARRLEQLTESVPGLICQLQLGPGTRPLRLPFASAPGLRGVGLTPEAVLEDAQPLLSRVLPDDLSGVLDSLMASARTLQPWQHQFRLAHPELGERWISGHASPERLEDGSTLWHGIMTDVTQRKRVEQALANNERQMRALIAAMDDLVVVVDGGGLLLGFHQPERLRVLTGLETPVTGQPYPQVLPAAVAEAIAQAVVQLQLEPGPVHREVAWAGPRGDLWLDLTVSVMAEDGDAARPYLCVGSDMSARKQREDELTALATTDALTRLPNRRHFLTRLDEELGRVRRYPEEETALLMLDLDHFKRVNDTYGHTVGDRVLQGFADVLRQTPRGADLPGRVGGEEFALLLPNTGREAAQAAADRVRREIEAMRVRLESGEAIAITVSVGVTRLLPDDDAERALHRADQALYRAKAAGRNRVELAWD